MIQNGDHNNTYLIGGPAYWIRLREFMDKCLGETTNWVAEDAYILIKQNPMTGQVVSEKYSGHQEIRHGGQPEEGNSGSSGQVLSQDADGNVKITGDSGGKVGNDDDTSNGG